MIKPGLFLTLVDLQLWASQMRSAVEMLGRSVKDVVILKASSDMDMGGEHTQIAPCL